MQDLVVTRSRAREDEFDDLIGPHLEAGYRTEILDEANAESSRCFIMGIGK